MRRGGKPRGNVCSGWNEKTLDPRSSRGFRTDAVSIPEAWQAPIRLNSSPSSRASAEANARLEQIQGRLSKLDSEVAEIRAAAEADFSAEEQRIKKAAEEDTRRVIETAESEITAAAKNARRELRTYAAELAVELAKKNIKVDAQTDAALVRDFVSQLGKDGK